MSTSPVVLAVEDEESDVFLLQLAFETARISHRLVVLRDGQELIDYLDRRKPFNDGNEFHLPGLLLLDLKMPRMDGFEVLTWLAFHASLQSIPVVVFSASTCEADMKKALQLGASDYLSKPSQFTALVQMVRALHQRWLSGPDSARETDALPRHRLAPGSSSS